MLKIGLINFLSMKMSNGIFSNHYYYLIFKHQYYGILNIVKNIKILY